jgi:hypothetical protein
MPNSGTDGAQEFPASAVSQSLAEQYGWRRNPSLDDIGTEAKSPQIVQRACPALYVAGRALKHVRPSACLTCAYDSDTICGGLNDDGVPVARMGNKIGSKTIWSE